MSFPDRRTYALLALAFMGFAVYASLVPLSFQSLALDEALARFVDIVWQWPSLGSFSRSDAVANLLLFVPIGFCLSGVSRLGARAWWSGPFTTIGVLTVALALSITVEFLQLFTAARTTSSGDIAAQFAGTLVGNVLWEAVGSDLTAWVRATLGSETSGQRFERLLLAYAGAWALLSLAPFDLTLDLGLLARKARTGGLVFSLFGRTTDTALDLAWDAFRAMAAAFPLGVLALFVGCPSDARRGVVSALSLAVGALVVVEGLQFFVVSRVADATDVVAGSLGVAAGVVVGLRWRGGAPPQSRGARAWVLLLLLAAWCLVLAAYQWMPYDFRWDPASVRAKLSGMSLIPFAAYHRGADLNSLDQLLIKLWLSVPLGVLSGFIAPRPPGRRRLWIAGWLLWAGLVIGVIEAGQLVLPSRHPDPTDVLVGLIGATSGLALTLWALRPSAERPAPPDIP